MQAISTALRNEIDSTAYTVYPQVIGEWNYNLIADIDTIYNDSPLTPYNTEDWPIESIASRRWTRTGIPRFILGEAVLRSDGSPNSPRLISPDDPYRYWVSPDRSTPALAGCRPTIEYLDTIEINRIYACFEVSFATPTSVALYYKNLNGDWITVATGLVPGADGVISADIGSNVYARGIRAVVSSMSQSNVHCHFIELSPRLRLDLTDRVISAEPSRELENMEGPLPIGESLSNELNLELDNADGLFDRNDGGLHLAQETVSFDVSAYYPDVNESIPLGIYYADGWDLSFTDVSVGVSATDSITAMQELYVPPCFYRDQKTSHIVNDLLERCGVERAEIRVVKDATIPYVWYNNDETLWTALTDLAIAAGATVFVDEQGTFVWQEYEYLHTNFTEPVLTIDADLNLNDGSASNTQMANDVVIRYNVYDENRYDGEVVVSALWESDEAIVLLARDLRANISATDTNIPLAVTEDDFKLWPDEGVVNIEGERIKYDRKTAGGPHHPALIDCTRGYMGTKAELHHITYRGNGAVYGMQGSYGNRQIKNGSLRMANNYNSPYDGYQLYLYGDASSDYTVYGTRLTYTDQTKHDMAGLALHVGPSGEGYYFELVNSDFVASSEAVQNELRCYRRDASGNRVGLPATTQGRAGYPIAVSRKTPYDLEVVHSNGNNSFTVYVNGEVLASFSDATYQSGKFGVFARGHTVVNFDYTYAVTTTSTPSIDKYRRHNPDEKRYFSAYSGSIHRGSNLFYDEYTPVVRMGMEFDIEFQVYPSINPRILLTNKWAAMLVDDIHSSFGSSFYIENISNRDAVISGDDVLLFLGRDIPQTILVYGRVVIKEEDEIKTYKNDQSIRKYGRRNMEISTPWLQTKKQADNLGRFITEYWDRPMDIIELDWVPNPALQPGDVVTVNFPERGFTAGNNKFHVMALSTSLDGSISGGVTLRQTYI